MLDSPFPEVDAAVAAVVNDPYPTFSGDFADYSFRAGLQFCPPGEVLAWVAAARSARPDGARGRGIECDALHDEMQPADRLPLVAVILAEAAEWDLMLPLLPGLPSDSEAFAEIARTAADSTDPLAFDACVRIADVCSCPHVRSIVADRFLYTDSRGQTPQTGRLVAETLLTSRHATRDESLDVLSRLDDDTAWDLIYQCAEPFAQSATVTGAARDALLLTALDRAGHALDVFTQTAAAAGVATPPRTSPDFGRMVASITDDGESFLAEPAERVQMWLQNVEMLLATVPVSDAVYRSVAAAVATGAVQPDDALAPFGLDGFTARLGREEPSDQAAVALLDAALAVWPVDGAGPRLTAQATEDLAALVAADTLPDAAWMLLDEYGAVGHPAATFTYDRVIKVIEQMSHPAVAPWVAQTVMALIDDPRVVHAVAVRPEVTAQALTAVIAKDVHPVTTTTAQVRLANGDTVAQPEQSWQRLLLAAPLGFDKDTTFQVASPRTAQPLLLAMLRDPAAWGTTAADIVAFLADPSWLGRTGANEATQVILGAAFNASPDLAAAAPGPLLETVFGPDSHGPRPNRRVLDVLAALPPDRVDAHRFVQALILRQAGA